MWWWWWQLVKIRHTTQETSVLCVLTWSYIVNNDPDRLYRYDLHLMHGSGRGSVVVRREVRAASVGSASVMHYFGRGFRG